MVGRYSVMAEFEQRKRGGRGHVMKAMSKKKLPFGSIFLIWRWAKDLNLRRG